VLVKASQPEMDATHGKLIIVSNSTCW
jgi:hypothetical protein